MIVSESNRETNHQHNHVRRNHVVEGHVGITRATGNHEIAIHAECELEGGADAGRHNQQLEMPRRDLQLVCFTKGKRDKTPVGGRPDEGEFEDESESMVCQMIGES